MRECIQRISTLVLLCTLLLPELFATAWAQNTGPGADPVEVPPALSPDAIGALVSKMNAEQTEALAKLMELLSESYSAQVTAPMPEGPDVLNVFEGWYTAFGESISTNTRRLPDLVRGAGAALAAFFGGSGTTGPGLFIVLLLTVVAIGAAVEWLFRRATHRWREQIRDTRPEGVLDAWRTLSFRAIIEIGGVLVFAVVTLIATRALFSYDVDQQLVSHFILKAILIARIADAVLRFLLAPRRPDLRLVSTDSWTAGYIHKQVVALSAVVGVALFLVAVMQQHGIGAVEPLLFWVSIGGHAWIIYVTFRARKGLTAIIKGADEAQLTPGLQRMAAWWPGLSIVVIALNWFLLEFIAAAGGDLTPGNGALALALIVMAPFLDTMVRGIAANLVPPMQGEGPVAEKAQYDTRLCYTRMGRVILLALLVFLIARLWGLNMLNLAEAGLGAQIGANIVGFLLLLAFGYVAWEITNLWINRRLSQELPEPSANGDSGEAGGTGLSRMATILPILRMTLQATIITITVLLALSQLGFNITPLLAGAGVLGLAIGFGAQTLVKDVVSGVFFLLDDAFRIGEYVDIGGTEGSVEKISVRSLQLRGATGPVHIVPYGSISKLTNMSRDWVIMKLKFTVPFDTDLEKVRKIFKKIGQQLEENPEYADDLISPFKSQGAADVTDVGIVVRGKFTTKPGGQWGLRKEIYTQVQKAFEENGIEFARKEVRVQMPGVDGAVPDLTAEQRRAISAAVSEAAEPVKPQPA